MNLRLAGMGLLLLVAGLTARQGSHDQPSAALLAEIPDKARTKPNPLANDPNAPAAGRKLFEQHCAQCHGGTASGGKKGPSLRTKEVRQATPGELFWIVSNGIVRHGMPAWSKLPEAQRWQIVRFVGEFR